MLSGNRILVVEREFLVALDMQRVLEEAHASQTVFARSIEEASHLAGQFGNYDLAIIEIPPDGDAGWGLVRELLAAGVAVVATSASDRVDSRATELGIWTVPKPFDDDGLVIACRAALKLA